MARVDESRAQSRESLARRLELSALRIEDDRVSGTIDGFEVALLGDAPFRECHVTLGGALPLSLLRLEHGDLNHPDAVETGDPDFDEAMQVLALPDHAPTLEQLLSSKGLRAQVLAFLRRFPDSFLRGNVLVLKSSEGVTHEAMLEAVEVAKALSKQFAQVGFVTTEAPPVVEPKPEKPSPRVQASAIMGGLLLVTWWWWASANEVGPSFAGLGTLILLSTTVVATWLAGRDR